eukprot:381747-Amphidinium_carterae.1
MGLGLELLMRQQLDRRMAESLEHQKVCVDINAARCSRWFPRSESKLQKMILAYNRQIESYHKQTEDPNCILA